MTWGATSCKNKHKMQTHEMSKKNQQKTASPQNELCCVQYNINFKPGPRKEKITSLERQKNEEVAPRKNAKKQKVQK